MKVAPALLIVAFATVAMLNLGRITEKVPFSVSRLDYVNTQAKYQLLLLGVTFLVLAAIYFVNRENLFTFLAPGDLAAPAGGIPWLGIPDKSTWCGVAAGLSLFITLGTSLFVYLQFGISRDAWGQIIPYLPWILLFSITNAFSEEVVYRLGIIVPLYGTVNPAYIMLISAVAFGAPHLRGMPNGLVGALMAGFLGWLLAKAVIETHGLFWAWFIHFLQDIVIFSAFVLAAAAKSVSHS